MTFLSGQENENEKMDQIAPSNGGPEEGAETVLEPSALTEEPLNNDEPSADAPSPCAEAPEMNKPLTDSEEEADNEGEEQDPTIEENTEEQAKPAEQKSGMIRFVYDTVELVAISLVLVMMILTVFARHSPVNGGSMFPTILGRNEGSASETVGKDVLLISDLFYTPEKGDIVVVQTPTIKKGNVALSLDHPIVKRVIATEHDRVEIDFVNWRIVINDKVYEDGLHSVSYVNYDNATLINGTPSKQMSGFYPDILSALRSDERCDFTQEGTVFSFTVPEGQVFVLGDNRNHSTDSRAIGLIDERWIIGKSLLRVYPFDRFGIVE